MPAGLPAGRETFASMPNTPDSATHFPDTVNRTVRLRLFPGDAATGILLTAIAGACRYVWNHMLADCEWRYARWKEMHVPALNWPDPGLARSVTPCQCAPAAAGAH